MTSLRLAAVGDISFGDNAVTASFGVDSLLRRTPRLDMFEHVRSLLRNHDLVFGNLETVLSDDGLQMDSLASRHMRGRPAQVDQLVHAGFNVVNVANNHILQHGARAFDQTVDLLRSRNIVPVGIAGRDGFHCAPARIEIGGAEIVFLGYAFEPDNYYSGVPLYAQAEPEEIVDDIRAVKSRDNYVACSFHWGREFVAFPSPGQIKVARMVIDAGADLVLGHHPHVLNGFEYHRGRPIFYSLGNCVFDQLWFDACTRSMAVHVTLSPEAVTVSGTDGLHIGADYRPVPVDDGTFDATLATLNSSVQEVARGALNHEREAARLEVKNRYLSWAFMLRNITRYDPAILKQILTAAVRRRLPNFERQGPAAGRT